MEGIAGKQKRELTGAGELLELVCLGGGVSVGLGVVVGLGYQLVGLCLSLHLRVGMHHRSRLQVLRLRRLLQRLRFGLEALCLHSNLHCFGLRWNNLALLCKLLGVSLQSKVRSALVQGKDPGPYRHAFYATAKLPSRKQYSASKWMLIMQLSDRRNAVIFRLDNAAFSGNVHVPFIHRAFSALQAATNRKCAVYLKVLCLRFELHCSLSQGSGLCGIDSLWCQGSLQIMPFLLAGDLTCQLSL